MAAEENKKDPHNIERITARVFDSWSRHLRGRVHAAGGVPRSIAGSGSASAAAPQNSVTRTPGAHVRVTFARPDHPIAYGYPAHTHFFRQNYPLYSVPRAWLRIAYYLDPA